MNIDYKTLYIKDNKGAIRQWSIGVEDYTIVIQHGQLGGSLQTATEEVDEGKAGRSLEEQIMSRVSSRINKQKDKGYKETISSAKKETTNIIGLPKPMLAIPFNKVKNIDFSSAYVQHKYDGNRCLIAKINGEKIAYTRNGKRYKVLSHILDSMDMLDNTIIDGELYCHGENLQTIVSWCKRDTPHENTHKLRYHCYDIISPKPFSERMDMLLDIDYGENSHFVCTKKVLSVNGIMDFFEQSRKHKYEGSIIRWGNFGYETGKRSKSLVKIKEWQDDIFTVVGINPSSDYWGVLTCVLPNNNHFSVTAPGTIEDKREVLVNRQNYLGKKIRVEYAYLTKEGKPFQPVATNWID